MANLIPNDFDARLTGSATDGPLTAAGFPTPLPEQAAAPEALAGVMDAEIDAAADADAQPARRAAGFDYDALPADVVTDAKAAAERVKTLLRSAVIDIGRELARAKVVLPHGQFGAWLKGEFGLIERTAQNYMSAAALADEYETVSVLRPKTIYLLAAPSTPEPALREILDRLNAGEIPSARAIRQTINKAKAEQQQEQRQAEEAARYEKLSPSGRRSRARRAAEQERREREDQQRQAEALAKIELAVALLLEKVDPKNSEEIADLLAGADSWEFLGALKRGLVNGAGPKSDTIIELSDIRFERAAANDLHLPSPPLHDVHAKPESYRDRRSGQDAGQHKPTELDGKGHHAYSGEDQSCDGAEAEQMRPHAGKQRAEHDPFADGEIDHEPRLVDEHERERDERIDCPGQAPRK